MTKSVKKKNLKLRRRIRKTAGALFLISSLLVAAIPTDNLRAAGESTDELGSATLWPASVNMTITQEESGVPYVDPKEQVYTTGDGMFQYAYVYRKGQSSGDKVAVIIGYSGGQLDNNVLTVPDTVDVYKKHTHSKGSGSGYIAVGKSGNDLWYKTSKQKVDQYGELVYELEYVVDENGDPVIDPVTNQQAIVKHPVMEEKVFPCYYEDYASWGEIALEELYTPIMDYDRMSDVNDPANYEKTVTEETKRVKSITVAYIGNQSLVTTKVTKPDGSDDELWSISEWLTPEKVKSGALKGVFAEKGNIVTLRIGERLEGIGDFAFYNCSGLSSVTLGNGINTIGNYAFANCVNLRQMNIPQYCNVTAFGNHTFYNCQSLTTFDTPVNVLEFGDYCFSKCSDMTDLNMYYSDGTKVLLNAIGDYCFTECSALDRLVFPASVDTAEHGTTIDISMFMGCKDLKSICFMSDSMDVFENTDYKLDDFKEEVTTEFYFEGLDKIKLHQTANNNEIAYKYLDQDLYEIVIREESGASVTYRVDSHDTLKSVIVEGNIKDVVMPSTIGPYKIVTVDSTSFSNKCTIEKVIIPASVEVIMENAFKGSHNLKHVIFEDADNIQSIGTDAFQTQKVNDGLCSHAASLDRVTPVLTFTGTISNSSVPFRYAMDSASKINQGNQPVTYITYYSGWPTNLTVQYTEERDAATLVDYPTLTDLTKFSSNMDMYPYMTPDYAKAAATAVAKLIATEEMTQDEREVVEACLDIVIPEGVIAVKDDLFAENEVGDLQTFSRYTKTVTTNTVNNISNGMFADWKNLGAAYILGDATTIGDYAFEGCEALEEVQISPNVDYLGLRPFRGCSSLNEVDFLGSSNYTCDKGIIYSLSNGSKDGIIECLETRGVSSGIPGTVQASELAGVKYIQKEAFKDCLGISEVDFKQSAIATVPTDAFSLTSDAKPSLSKMNRVLLPSTCKAIEEGAFTNSPIVYLEIPSSVTYIDPAAFNTEKNSSKYEQITFYCEPDSAAAIYADNHESIVFVEREPDAQTHMVVIQYLDPVTQQYHTIETQNVQTGKNAIKPAIEDLPVIEGYSFLKWLPSDDFTNILADCTYTAIYSDTQYTVNFYECDEHENTFIGSITVAEGANVTSLDYPEYTPVEGYEITGWTGLVNPVTQNLNVYAKCEEATYTVNFWVEDGSGEQKLVFTQSGKLGDAVYQPKDPTADNKKFAGWLPKVSETITGDADYYATFVDGSGNVSGGGTNTGTGNGNGTGTAPTPAPAFYTLTVKNGSGSGSYAAGSQVIIYANEPTSGQTFSRWTVEPSDVNIAVTTADATVITMPAKNVTVTANYKKSSSSSTGSGSSNSSNSGGGSSHITGGNITTNGSTVVIDKNGLSNTGVVSVKVNGSADNFTIKVQESAYAKEQAIKALIAAYGDLTNIVYFPMDISLYDSTGTKLITDTTGLSISITLPLPDSMIAYAGNNKVASVTDGTLERLGAKFTTIDGVSCITFTAEHFSPYVIYVDKGNLTAGTVNDDTPKTGDGVHPKWFLSIGLLCIAMILFLKKDKVVAPAKVRVAAAR